MKIIKIERNKMLKIVTIIVFFIIITIFSNSFGMQSYYKVDFQTAIVTATTLNVRSGPGTGYKVVTTVKKGEYLRVFAGVGNWYVVQVDGDFIGTVSKQYVKPITPGNSTNSNTSGETTTTTKVSSDLSSDEWEVFNLINQQRTNNGLNALKIDNEVQRVAKIKAQDMVNNNYFSHNSPTYGSPFDMLNSFKIYYKTAGENIAGNSNNSAAVTSWMNSPGHKANILNGNFNYTGIGVVNGSQYGKIYVQVFIGK